MGTALTVVCAVALIGAIIALIIVARAVRKEQSFTDEAFKKIQEVLSDDVKIKLDLAQVTANRDLLNETINALKGDIDRLNILKELVEGQRDSLISELNRVDKDGNAVAHAVNVELQKLSKLSKTSSSNR